MTHPGLGKSIRRWCISLMRSPISPEKQTGSPPLCGAVLGKAACYLPPVLHPGALPRACDMRQVITRDGWWLLLRCSALHPEDPKCVVWNFFFGGGTFSNCMSIFLRNSLNKASLRDTICYYRFLSLILGKAVKNINVLKLRGVPTDVECNALLQPLLRGLLCNPEGEPGLQSFLLAGRKAC